MKRLTSIFIFLCLPTFAFADEGCTLEFKPNGTRLTKLENVVSAWQSIIRDSIIFTDTDGKTHSANTTLPHLYDLQKVDGIDINNPDYWKKNNFVDSVLFSCDKKYGSNYIAYKCRTKRSTGTKVGQDKEGYPYYDKCISDDTPTIFQQLDALTTRSTAWRNEDGSFNTTRLISDSIAGVVLGTAGGIITSKIVGKNQIDNGMQDLKCTINGQNIASFGDDFVVEFNN